jgi:hypothetical protein
VWGHRGWKNWVIAKPVKPANYIDTIPVRGQLLSQFSINRRVVCQVVYYFSIIIAWYLVAADKLLGGFSATVLVITTITVYGLSKNSKTLWSFPLAFVFAAGLSYVLMLIINAGLLTSSLRNKIKHGIVVIEDGSITDFARHGIFEAVVAPSVVLALGRIALWMRSPRGQS